MRPSLRRLACALGLLAGALAGCGRRGIESPQGGGEVPPAAARLARKVEVAAVRQQDLTYTVDTVGTLEPERQTSIASGVAGIVDEVLFREGDAVDPETTVLVKIDQRRYEAARALAKANEQRAQ